MSDSNYLQIPSNATVRLVGIYAPPVPGGWRYHGVDNGYHVFRRGDDAVYWPTREVLAVRRDPQAPDQYEVEPDTCKGEHCGFD